MERSGPEPMPSLAAAASIRLPFRAKVTGSRFWRYDLITITGVSMTYSASRTDVKNILQWLRGGG